MDRKIDYDRGVLIMTEPNSGVDVFMYIDAPGVYLNAHALEVPEALARSAGYDIEKNQREKLKLDRMSAAKQAIERDLKDGADDTGEVIKLDGGYSIVGTGFQQYILKDPDGNVLTNTPLTKAMAEQVVKLMLKKEEPVQTPQVDPKAAGVKK